MKKKWLWLLSAVLIAVMILPAAVFAEGEIVLYADSESAEFNSYTITLPENTSWLRSSTEAVVKVDNDGKVTAQGVGQAVVRAFDTNDDKVGEWSFEVKNRTLQRIFVDTEPTKKTTTRIRH